MADATIHAAVLHELRGVPRYELFPAPVAGDDVVEVEVAAAALKPSDRLAASGVHYDDVDWPVAVALWSEVAVRTGDRRAAAQLLEILRPHDGIRLSSGTVGCGPTARLLALLEILLGRPVDADQHFAEAVAFSEHLMSPVWTARCRLDWAQTQLDRGQTADAHRLTEEADAAAGELDLPALCRQWTTVRDELDQT
ncbi:MAG TPA: hypothetical protein VIJ09_02235 [Acidimicrobiales bacterium]|jgi:hypothetical protein